MSRINGMGRFNAFMLPSFLKRIHGGETPPAGNCPQGEEVHKYNN